MPLYFLPYLVSQLFAGMLSLNFSYFDFIVERKLHGFE